MTTDRDTLHIVGSWLEEGRTRLPEHVLDAVLDQLPATRQRRPRRWAWRMADMNPLSRYAIAAAAVVMVAVVGIGVLGATSQSQVGNRSPSPVAPGSPSVAPPSEEPRPPMSGLAEPGRHGWKWSGGLVSFVVPDGWTWTPEWMAKYAFSVNQIALTAHWPDSAYAVTHVYADACSSAGQLRAIGPSVADLVAALDDQAGTDIVESSISTEMASGRRVEVRQTAALDRATCRGGALGPLQVWADESETVYFSLDPGYWSVVYAFDVAGSRVVFSALFDQHASDEDVAEVDAIIASLEFGASLEPRPAGPSGSLPSRRLPGTRASPAGVYGWQGGEGSSAGMHKVIEGESREATALIFRVGPRCLAASQAEKATPVRVAGFDGLSVEPYDPPVAFVGPDGDETTRALALNVEGRTLCVFVTWHATTTDVERDAALQVLDTLRVEPIGEHSIRVVFRLDEGWDTG